MGTIIISHNRTKLIYNILFKKLNYNLNTYMQANFIIILMLNLEIT